MSVEAKRETSDAMERPRVGDKFSEMCNFWVEVVAIDSDGQVAVKERVGGDEKLRLFQTQDEYRAAYAYGSIPGYWIILYKRGAR